MYSLKYIIKNKFKKYMEKVPKPFSNGIPENVQEKLETEAEKREESIEQKKPHNKEIIEKLDKFVLNMKEASANEAIRLIESDKFDKLEMSHINEVRNYHSIEIDGEKFFDEPFATGKEVGDCLIIAKQFDKEVVLKKLKEGQQFSEESKEEK